MINLPHISGAVLLIVVYLKTMASLNNDDIVSHEVIEHVILTYYMDEDDDDAFVLAMAVDETDTHQVDTTHKKRKTVIRRSRREIYDRIMKDYLVAQPTFPEISFRRRFRMSSRLFKFIREQLESNTEYFTWRRDISGREGVSPLQKIVCAMRMLAYGESADRQDEYCHIGEKTALDSRKQFCQAILKLFSTQYLKKPGPEDIHRLINENGMRGFPGMIGMIVQLWLFKSVVFMVLRMIVSRILLYTSPFNPIVCF